MGNVSDNKRIVVNTIFLYVRMIIVLLVSLYTTRIVYNEMGIIDYGIYNVVAGFISMFAFFNTAMINSIQRFYNYEKINKSIERLQIIYNTALRIQFLLAVSVLFLIETIGLWYINNKMIIPSDRIVSANIVFHLSSISLVVLILQVPYSASIVSHEKMSFFAFASLVDVVLKFIIAISISYVPYDKLIFYGILMLVTSLINFLLYYSFSKNKFPEIRLSKKYDKTKFKEMICFACWNTFDAFAYMIQGQGLNILANLFFGPAVNAARAISFQIQNAITGFSENIATAFRPQLVESYAKGSYDRTKDLMFSMSKFCFLMLSVLTMPIALELNIILSLWLGKSVPEYTYEFTILVLINMLLGALNMPITQTVQATGHIRNYQLLRSFLVTLSLPISWLFLNHGYPPTIIFVVVLFISIINQPFSLMLLRRRFTYSYVEYIKTVIIPCLLFIVCAPILPFILHVILEESIFRTICVTTLSFISSFFIIYYIVLSFNERKIVIGFIRKILKR